MPKFAANLSFLFTDVPFPSASNERPLPVSRASNTSSPTTGRRMRWPIGCGGDLEQVLFNLSPGDWAAGERGLACLPHRQGEFAESVEQALNYAMVLDCERLHCMAGLRPCGCR
jgi:hydroxypyruvate isomerase